MKHRIHKALLWLFMTVMVLFGAAGCVTDMTEEEKAQALQAAGEVVEAMLEAGEEAEAEEAKVPERESIQARETEAVRQTDDETEAAFEKQKETEIEERAEEQIAEYAHTDVLPDEHASYTSREDVSLYIYTYGHLPENFITRKEAEKLGWNSKEGNLWDVAPGMSIGGSHFGNYEKLLPEKKGRRYYECDIDYDGGYRGAKRIIYSNDGLIFYTDDHYESFEQLY